MLSADKQLLYDKQTKTGLLHGGKEHSVGWQYLRSKQLDIVQRHVCFAGIRKLWGRDWLDACQALPICNMGTTEAAHCDIKLLTMM